MQAWSVREWERRERRTRNRKNPHPPKRRGGEIFTTSTSLFFLVCVWGLVLGHFIAEVLVEYLLGHVLDWEEDPEVVRAFLSVCDLVWEIRYIYQAYSFASSLTTWFRCWGQEVLREGRVWSSQSGWEGCMEKALSDRFSGEIPDDQMAHSSFFPDEYFTCSSLCLSCG